MSSVVKFGSKKGFVSREKAISLLREMWLFSRITNDYPDFYELVEVITDYAVEKMQHEHSAMHLESEPPKATRNFSYTAPDIKENDLETIGWIDGKPVKCNKKYNPSLIRLCPVHGTSIDTVESSLRSVVVWTCGCAFQLKDQS